MRLLIAHNFYQQPGGEDQVFASEVALLKRFGHEVRRLEVHNDAIDRMSKLAALRATIWNKDAYAMVRSAVREHRAQVVHFHNTFPLLSPAAYDAARDEGAAVVQTLHNFRLLCPNALFFRDGRPCEDCLGKAFAWPGIAHKCYRGSRAASAAVAVMSAAHRIKGTWRDAVDLYLAPTEFARAKFIAGGLPLEKILVKPNFVDPDPGTGSGDGGYAVFVARLSHEKGLDILLEAWRLLAGSIQLKIIGDGPLAELVKRAVADDPVIEWLGRQPLEQVYAAIGRAGTLIFPSFCYETFGRVAVEAFAKGVPVIASNHGAMADVVTHGVTGLLFEPGNAAALAAAVRELSSDSRRRDSMGQAAREQYLSRYNGDANHAMLMAAYEQAIDASQGVSSRAGQATNLAMVVPIEHSARVENPCHK